MQPFGCFLLPAFLIQISNNAIPESQERQAFAIPPPVWREVCRQLGSLKNEGAGNAGRPMRPIPRVQ
jgi:hypothetical protein